jgi:hypothetical protein
MVPSSSPEEHQSLPASMPEANRTASPLLATTAVRCSPKVSESSSQRRHNAVDENLVEFGGPKRQ